MGISLYMWAADPSNSLEDLNSAWLEDEINEDELASVAVEYPDLIFAALLGYTMREDPSPSVSAAEPATDVLLGGDEVPGSELVVLSPAGWRQHTNSWPTTTQPISQPTTTKRSPGRSVANPLTTYCWHQSRLLGTG